MQARRVSLGSVCHSRTSSYRRIVRTMTEVDASVLVRKAATLEGKSPFRFRFRHWPKDPSATGWRPVIPTSGKASGALVCDCWAIALEPSRAGAAGQAADLIIAAASAALARRFVASIGPGEPHQIDTQGAPFDDGRPPLMARAMACHRGFLPKFSSYGRPRLRGSLKVVSQL